MLVTKNKVLIHFNTNDITVYSLKDNTLKVVGEERVRKIFYVIKSSSAWIGLTNCGSWNIEFLHLSDKDQIQRREDRREIEKMIEEAIEQREGVKRYMNEPKLSASAIQNCKNKIEMYDNQAKVLKEK